MPITHSDHALRTVDEVLLEDLTVSPPFSRRIVGDDFVPPFTRPGGEAYEIRTLRIPVNSRDPDDVARKTAYVYCVRGGTS